MPLHFLRLTCLFFFFFFNDTATTEIYTLSPHDALPISPRDSARDRRARTLRPRGRPRAAHAVRLAPGAGGARDRKSTRLNSGYGYIAYAVFCLKKKTEHQRTSLN